MIQSQTPRLRPSSQAALPALAVLLLLTAGCASRKQRADSHYHIQVANPVWQPGAGPRVAVDAAHHNFHTIDGRYRAFADLLRADGCQVTSFDSKFTPESLTSELDIVVISNALAEENTSPENWRLPVYSAFTKAEVASLLEWIRQGGSLLLIADHMPMPAAAAPLAEALGIEFTNSYAIREGDEERRDPLVFSVEDGTLNTHPILEGRNPSERVDRVATFTGQAFRGELQPLLTFGPGIVAVFPEVFGEWDESTRRESVEGWEQGATLEVGKGRVAVFGEAAMFSAQVTARGGEMGMNAEIAAQNPQFLLNVMHWLARKLD